MRFQLWICGLVAASLAGSSHATAASAPAGLRGKSVTATWTEIRLQRLGGMGDFKEHAVSQSLSAYISSEGRVFAKRTVYAGRKGKSGSVSSVGENAPGVQGSQFSGQSLVITNKLSGGARMARISFDSGFSSCTASVILGRENGTGVAKGRSNISGAALEIKSATVSNTNCSVRTGNVFGE
jgi:hypothetical protein